MTPNPTPKRLCETGCVTHLASPEFTCLVGTERTTCWIELGQTSQPLWQCGRQLQTPAGSTSKKAKLFTVKFSFQSPQLHLPEGVCLSSCSWLLRFHSLRDQRKGTSLKDVFHRALLCLLELKETLSAVHRISFS